MHLRKHIGMGLILAVTAIIITSCSKMDDGYKDIIKDGEIVYTGRVDSVKTYPGKNRIGLSMLLLSDPKISKVKVFWNSKSDSAVQDIVRTSGVDTVNFMLNNMAEGSYSFEIYTYDNNGHSSVKTVASGMVYGQNYINSLFNRSLRSVTYLPGSKARLIWYGPSSQTTGQEINYIDSLGAPRYEFVPRAKDTTILVNFKKLDYFQYRTLYKPETNALDTFHTGNQSVQVL